MTTCEKCKHCVWDGKAPLLYCDVEGTYRPPCTEDCDTFAEREEQESVSEEEVIVLYDFNISGLLVCDESRTALDVVDTILDESPTLRQVFKRMAVRKIVMPADKSEDVGI